MADITGYLDIIRNATSGESVRDAIINCMNDINKDAAVQITTKAISGKLSNINKTYKAPTGYAWSQVSLSVTDDDGEEKIVNDIISDELTINDDTPNGDYEPETNHVYSKVHVDVTRDRTDIVDNVNISLDDLDEMNGYSAISHGYNAMKRVTFIGANIAAATGGTVGPGGVVYYTVTFLNIDGETIYTTQVAKGGKAIFKGTKPTSGGLSFIGWDPSPDYVTKNMTCSPVFDEISFVIGEITDSWKTIIANKGAKYPIGSYKSVEWVGKAPYGADKALFPNSGISDSGVYSVDFSAVFFKVGTGVDGNTSTWLSAPVNADTLYPSHLPGAKSADGGFIWESRSERAWLNNTFFSYIVPNTTEMPFKKNIKQALKYTVVTDGNITDNPSPGSIKIGATKDLFWVPSVKELYINDEVDDDGIFYHDGSIARKYWSYSSPNITKPDGTIAKYITRPTSTTQYFENWSKSQREEFLQKWYGKEYNYLVVLRDEGNVWDRGLCIVYKTGGQLSSDRTVYFRDANEEAIRYKYNGYWETMIGFCL